ncbi:MAG: hypothetical protein E7670_00625 [Ruminococcaceae bacterium]|nr:hypothetical protein [Oscillospiraceae bacterium]
MKKELNKILIILGFIVAVVGACLAVLLGYPPVLMSATTVSNIAALLAVTFIFASNSIIKNIGYTLSILLIIDSLKALVLNSTYDNIGFLVYYIGFIVMAVGAIIYFVVKLLAFFGFVKNGSTKPSENYNKNLLDELMRYKEMQQEKVLTEEEFSELKEKILENNAAKTNSIDDLKKWKKLVDQQVITEEEFSKIKSDIFNK